MTDKKNNDTSGEENDKLIDSTNGEEKDATADELVMQFENSTINHLGVQMYSRLPLALGELIANAYDADAEHIEIELYDKTDEKRIIIRDNGIGMSFEDINEQFLKIGRNRRENDNDKTTRKGRKAIGKKGLGKLAFFGIADHAEINTRQDKKQVTFEMDKNKLLQTEGKYKPQFKSESSAEADGTEIILKRIKRQSPFKPEALANSIARIFIVGDEFKITIKHNENNPIEVSNDMRYKSLKKQIEWEMPDDIETGSDYEHASEIRGVIMSTVRPLKAHMRGITLFSRNKLVNTPEFFLDSTSSHAFSYLTGWLSVDFIDELQDEAISTNRQSILWDLDDMQELRDYLGSIIKKIIAEWRIKRPAKERKKLQQKTSIDLDEWANTMPKDLSTKIDNLTSTIIELAADDSSTIIEAIETLYQLIPPHPYFHYRTLHPAVQNISFDKYKNKDFYSACAEALKEYLNKIRDRTGKQAGPDGTKLIEEVFGSIDQKNNFHHKFPSEYQLADDTLKSFKRAQYQLSKGMVSGYRNSLSHSTQETLRDSELLTEQDCLDGLSMLSHLFRRLDQTEFKS